MSRLAKCIKSYIIDEPAMREKDMNGVRKRVALTFSNRQFRRNVEHSGDRNWLQIDVGVAFKMILDLLETVICKNNNVAKNSSKNVKKGGKN